MPRMNEAARGVRLCVGCAAIFVFGINGVAAASAASVTSAASFILGSGQGARLMSDRPASIKASAPPRPKPRRHPSRRGVGGVGGVGSGGTSSPPMTSVASAVTPLFLF